MKSGEALTTQAVPDATAVQRIASGDLESLGLLFYRHEPDIRRVLARLGIDAADVDDLVQFTFLQVIRAAPEFDARFSVRNWLVGIAAMMARRHRRSIRRATDRIASWTYSLGKVSPVTPDEELDSTETQRLVFRALGRLSAKRREAFVLVALEGIPGEAAATSLGIPLNTLWTRLHHARHDLRAWLLPRDT